MLIRGLIKKVCSWPFSTDPEGHHSVDWDDGEKQLFYDHISNRRFSDALQIIRTKATRYSLDEMGLLMQSFEREVNKKRYRNDSNKRPSN